MLQYDLQFKFHYIIFCTACHILSLLFQTWPLAHFSVAHSGHSLHFWLLLQHTNPASQKKNSARISTCSRPSAWTSLLTPVSASRMYTSATPWCRDNGRSVGKLCEDFGDKWPLFLQNSVATPTSWFLHLSIADLGTRITKHGCQKEPCVHMSSLRRGCFTNEFENVAS